MTGEVLKISAGMPQLDEARKARIDAFSAYVAVLPWFNIDVLHKLYLNIFGEVYEEPKPATDGGGEYDIRAITCADFLHAPSVIRIDYNVFIIEQEVRELLRNQMMDQKATMKLLGEFMLAYASHCRHHFLSIRYLEVYKIEGNLIVNPQAEAGRIAQHVAQQLNGQPDLQKMEPSVAYYLNMLDKNDQNSGNKELTNFLKGLDNYLREDKESAEKEWEKLTANKEGLIANSINVKLPNQVRKTILEKIGRATPERQGRRRLYALIVGINDYPSTPLFGSVNDALAVHEMLSQLVEANPDSFSLYEPKLLLAPHVQEDRDTLNEYGIGPGDYELPTRENMAKAFRHFKQAKSDTNDICLFYYSGQGASVPAPEVFGEQSSLSTFVCQDSRSPGGKDLIDKELTFLLWDALHEQMSNRTDNGMIHTLLILDACHSGVGTPGQARASRKFESLPVLEDFLGFDQARNDEGNYTDQAQAYLAALQKWNTIPITKLAATQSQETAKETMLEDRSSGVFTYSLLKTLRQGGMQLSYRELIERVKMMVRNRVDEQTPNLSILGEGSEYMTFLGGQLRDPVTNEYIIYYDQKQGAWMLDAGANRGIIASDSVFGKSRVQAWRIGAKVRKIEADIISVGATESILDGDGFTMDDQKYEDWVAKIINMAVPTIKVYIDEDLKKADRKKLTDEALEDDIPTYEFVEKEAEATYITYHIDGEYVLTKKESNVPIFRRNASARVFLTALQNVGQWLRVLEMENLETTIVREDIEVKAEIVEGVPLRLNNLNSVPASRKLYDPREIKLNYKKQKGNAEKQIQPGLRIQIKTTNRPYYIACLYMDSQYGIAQNLGTTEIRPDGNGEWLKFTNKGIEYRTIPISFDDNYHKLGITEITDYLKIFVSTKEFPVKALEQDELGLDDKLVEITRSGTVMSKGTGLDDDKEFENTGDWASFLIPIKVRRPLSKQEQVVGGADRNVASIGGARLTVPKGFSAKVSAASVAEINEMVNEATERSVAGADKLRNTLMPPPILWGTTPSRNTIFSRGVSSAAPDAQLSVLEITGASGDNVVSEENPIIFEPDGGLAEDEVLVSFAYDEATGMYLPLGFSDEGGQLHIENLPQETAGKIIGDGSINERSLGGSIKLFFRKVVIGSITGQTNNNTLALCSLGEDGVSVATAVGDGALSEKKNVCLLIHGIIGDTEVQRQAFFENDSKLNGHFDAVISYDYENLNTPIEETAKLLKSDLARTGVTEAGGQRLTIVAHGMGGLVSRWFIEHEDGDKVVRKLVQLGTPNGGSEASDFRKSIFGMMSMAMNGAAFLKPYLPVLSFIGKRVTKAVFHTLNQISPTESDFLRTLNKNGSPQASIPYIMIGGSTNDIELKKMDDQPKLQQFWVAVKTKTPYMLLNKLMFKTEGPNDMAVTQVSMKNVPTQENLQFYSVGCDHLTYFASAEVIQILNTLLKEEERFY